MSRDIFSVEPNKVHFAAYDILICNGVGIDNSTALFVYADSNNDLGTEQHYDTPFEEHISIHYNSVSGMKSAIKDLSYVCIDGSILEIDSNFIVEKIINCIGYSGPILITGYSKIDGIRSVVCELVKYGYTYKVVGDNYLVYKSNIKRAICVPTYNRPYYLSMTLNSLLRCRQTNLFDIYFLVDGVGRDEHDAATKSVIESFISKNSDKFNSCVAIYRTKNVGLTANILWGLRDTIGSGYEYSIILEDDLILSMDALEFVVYLNEMYDFHKSGYFSITGCSGNDSFFDSKIGNAHTSYWHKSLFVSYPKFVWDFVKDHVNEVYYGNVNSREQEHKMKQYLYKVFYEKAVSIGLDDKTMNRLFINGVARYPLQAGLMNLTMITNNFKQIYPFCSRSKHIGAIGWNQKVKHISMTNQSVVSKMMKNPDDYFHVDGNYSWRENFDWKEIIIDF